MRLFAFALAALASRYPTPLAVRMRLFALTLAMLLIETPIAAKPPFGDELESDQVDFKYSWSAEANAIPALAERFATGSEEARTKISDFIQAGYEGDYIDHTLVGTAGQSSRLLSLWIDRYEYSGGAHPIGWIEALLWDRAAAKEIKVADLFAKASDMDRLLTQRWCTALNQAREKRRRGLSGAPDECPKLDDIIIVPIDKNKNGRFEQLRLVASPYVAGPYSEGGYEIGLGMTRDLIAALKHDYRASFEVGRSQ